VKKQTDLSVESGQSLIEVMLVILLVSVFLVSLVTLSSNTVRRLSFSSHQAQAKNLLEQDLESARSIRDKQGLSVLDSCHDTTTDSSGFTVDRSCTAIADNKLTITTIVSWSDSSGDHSVSAGTILGDNNLW